ncbi:MAG: hypothetical protein HOP10_07730 [Chitinophagaceae bacterium]|nr:hypothetical protein [Chitinophagaceae bacterium]
MNAQINQLVRSLLQKDSIEQCSVQELQQYAERHPYFGAAQLLLTKKLQTENAEQYNEQLQKTLLYFHNPLWVEQLLNDTGTAIISKPEEAVVEIKDIPQTVETKKEAEIILTGEPAIVGIAVEETPVELPTTEIEKPGPEKKEELLFEPFHTVDYFASQGIKFKEEEKPKDKFGQQLKSFTDWLKAMKRLPVAEITTVVESKSAQKVEQLAETSLKEREVVTETMAEVWEKQGNAEKAIGIYSKLSLLEPSKSTYFAAKIEELKKKN